jgi:hypothetical protein
MLVEKKLELMLNFVHTAEASNLIPVKSVPRKCSSTGNTAPAAEPQERRVKKRFLVKNLLIQKQKVKNLNIEHRKKGKNQRKNQNSYYEEDEDFLKFFWHRKN